MLIDCELKTIIYRLYFYNFRTIFLFSIYYNFIKRKERKKGKKKTGKVMKKWKNKEEKNKE